MSSRESILAAIKTGKPAEVALNDFQLSSEVGDPLKHFISTLTSIGGKCIEAEDYTAVNEHIRQQKEAGFFIVQTIAEANEYNSNTYANATAGVLEGVEIVYIKGEIPISENGSVWVSETVMVNRLLPFICQHLVMVVHIQNMVSTMHEAFTKINLASDGYGVFIAGPSKTADIEQSLVIGAHGPLSLTVFLLP